MPIPLPHITTYLQHLEHVILHNAPPQDLVTQKATSTQRQDILLAAHLYLLTLNLLNPKATDPELLHHAQDLAATLVELHPTFGIPLSTAISTHTRPLTDRPLGVALTSVQLHHTAALLLDTAQDWHRPLPTTMAEGTAFWQAYTRPPIIHNPLHPTLERLRPPLTLESTRQPREQDLLYLLGASTLKHEQYAALILLTCNARDRITNFALHDPLDSTAYALLAARDIHTEHHTSPQHTKALWTHLKAIQQDLGTERLPGLRPGALVLRAQRQAAAERLLIHLRDMHYQQSAPTPPVVAELQQVLWSLFDDFDQELTQGRDPTTQPFRRLQLLLTAPAALASTHRAPGMALPPLIEIAAQLSHTDPLWAWQNFHTPKPTHLLLLPALHTVMLLLYFKPDPLTDTPEQNAEWHKLIHEFIGHLQACLRIAQLRLPHHQEVEQLLTPYGPFRGSAFSEHEYPSTNQRFQRFIEQQTQQRQTRGTSTHPDVPAPQDPELVLPLPPKEAPVAAKHAPLPHHVQAARALVEGRALTLIGGVPDPAHHQALVDALGLADLEWIGADEYNHGTHAHSRVTDQTAVVILAIRWMGHAHNGLRDVAKAKGVPYVMHPGGLNPSSVAWQILQQASTQLLAHAST
ncbi:hypothetical protein [Deinococcus sp. Leaf326]|uniref:hypothetical protein n=1 Tax=Deinococcus sp. Leaf326 TaxID=1736338 RepID=UPI000AF62BBC|nr:hypothetical protein [Deinococcus sp. Leaf326]